MRCRGFLGEQGLQLIRDFSYPIGVADFRGSGVGEAGGCQFSPQARLRSRLWVPVCAQPRVLPAERYKCRHQGLPPLSHDPQHGRKNMMATAERLPFSWRDVESLPHRNGSDSPSRQQDRTARRASRRKRQSRFGCASRRAARRRLHVPAIHPRPGAVPVRGTLARRMRACGSGQAAIARPPPRPCQPCRHVRREPAPGRQTARASSAPHHHRLRPPRRWVSRRNYEERSSRRRWPVVRIGNAILPTDLFGFVAALQ